MTEQQNDIQRAREILDKWRDYTPSTAGGRWHVSGYEDPGGHTHIAADSRSIEDLGFVRSYEDATLIVGTAGNPDLLDAIDSQLAYAQTVLPNPYPEIVIWSQALAAAIIAAENRMSA